MKSSIFIFALLTLTFSASAQNYFPVDTSYQIMHFKEFYVGGYGGGSKYSIITYNVVADTQIAGKTWYKFNRFPGLGERFGYYVYFNYVRYDSTDNKIYALLDSDTVLTYMDFNLSPGDTLPDCNEYLPLVVYEYEKVIFNDTVNAKGFKGVSGIAHFDVVYADGYGLLYMKLPGVMDGYHYFDLIQALIMKDSLTYFHEGYLPEFQQVNIPDTVSHLFNHFVFLCDHEYSRYSYSNDYVTNFGVSFIDRIEVESFYSNGIDTVFNDISYAGAINEKKFEFRLLLDNNLTAHGYDYYFRYVAYDEGLITQQRSYPDTGYKKITYVPVSVEDDFIKPEKFLLEQNYPNPFNPSTNITFTLPVAAHTTLEVYSVLGEKVATLINGIVEPGTYSKIFDGSNLSSGTYFYTLKASTDDGKSFFDSGKMLLLK